MPPKRKGRLATQQPPAKRTRSMSSNIQPTRERAPDGHSGSTRGRGRARSAHNHSTGNSVHFTSSSSGAPASTMPTTQPGDSSGLTSAMVPQEMIRQLSDVLTHLTNAIQVSDPPQATGSTPNSNNTTPEGDDSTPDTDALSEVSDEQQHNTTSSFSVMPPAVVNNTNAVCYTPLSATVPTVSLPPVPPRIKEKIISGEFIDLATLLPKAMFLGSEPETSKSLMVHLTPTGNDLSVRPQPSSKKISSFVSWMEAWNIYLAIIINHSPARAPQLVAYQRIITSASIHYPLSAWLNYDVQFRTLAASDPLIRWDIRHTDLWLQCVTTTPPPAIRWPCPQCGATNHYPENCPFRRHITPAATNRQGPHTSSLFSSGQQHLTGGQFNYRPPTCHAFNRSICRRANCTFAHHCDLCGANHSARYCPSKGSPVQ